MVILHIFFHFFFRKFSILSLKYVNIYYIEFLNLFIYSCNKIHIIVINKVEFSFI